jgi:hypothetical protein
MTPKRYSSDELSRNLRPAWRGFLVAVVIACGLASLAAYLQIQPTADERKIRAVCRDLAHDAERRDRAALERLVSPNYRDERGLTREDALNALLGYLNAGNWTRIRPVAVVVNKIEGNKASASAKVLLAQADSPVVRPTEKNAFQLDLQLAREGGRWRVLSAEDWQLPAADLEQAENE